MRGLALTLFIVALLPVAVMHPYVGALLWTWISLMNPHRLTFGFAYNFPFAQLVAIATLLGLILSRDPKRIPVNALTVVVFLFVIWMSFTSVLAIHPEQGVDMWWKVIKIQVMIFVALMVLRTRRHVDWLVWIIVISLGFYGTKGGVFTLLRAGSERVLGPGGFIGGNNELALALVMTIPLMRYLQLQAKTVWIRNVFWLPMLLTAAAALGTFSRGGMLAIAAMGIFLWLKSRKKFALAIAIVVAGTFAVSFMPQKWWDRMETIRTYEQDGSAQGRLNAWAMAFNLAKDRPIGGGFEVYTPDLFYKYAPNKRDVPRAAHSIYFQVLGEHGFPGLALFLLIGVLTWRYGSWTISQARGRPELAWAHDLASMIQVSMVGYAVGGAFLSLAYYDLPYYEMVLIVILRELVRSPASAEEAPAAADAGAPKPRKVSLHRWKGVDLPSDGDARSPRTLKRSKQS